jgi:hypothetical protein
MTAKRFKNGNINIKLDGTENPHCSDVEEITFALERAYIDFDFISDSYCISNYDMAFDIYDSYMDKIICMIHSEIDRIAEGKTVKFYAHTPDEFEREIIAAECGAY